MQKTLSALTLSGSIAILVTLCSTGIATAQQQCAERADILEVLSSRYGETPISLGVAASCQLVEVLSSDQGASWTIIVTSPEGVSCLVASGDGWRTLAPTIHGIGT